MDARRLRGSAEVGIVPSEKGKSMAEAPNAGPAYGRTGDPLYDGQARGTWRAWVVVGGHVREWKALRRQQWYK